MTLYMLLRRPPLTADQPALLCSSCGGTFKSEQPASLCGRCAWLLSLDPGPRATAIRLTATSEPRPIDFKKEDDA